MKSLATYQKRIAVFVMVIAMSFGFFAASGNQVAAQQLPVLEREYELTTLQTNEELRAMLINLIRQLMAQIASLQAQANATPENRTPITASLTVGDMVETTDNLSVRTNPAARLIGVVAKGTTGTIVAGPQFVDGRTWWRVEYNRPIGNQPFTSGWSAGNWLLQVAGEDTTEEVVEPVEEEEKDEEEEQIDDVDEIVAEDLFCDAQRKCSKGGLRTNFFDVDVDDINTEVSDDRTVAEFTFELEIEADEEDLFIKRDSFLALVSIGEKADYMYDEAVIETIAEASTAEEEKIGGEWYYAVEEGDVEDFTITVYYDPVVTNDYVATLYGFDFRLGDSKPYSLDLWPERPESEFVALAGMSLAEWQGENMVEEVDDEDDLADELRTIINQLVTQVENSGETSVVPSASEREESSVAALQAMISTLQAQIASLQSSNKESLMIRSSSANPDAATLLLDENDSLNDFVVFTFQLDASDSENELTIEEVVLDFDVSDGYTVSDLATEISISINGVLVDAGVSGTDLVVALPNKQIPANEVVEVEVLVSFDGGNAVMDGTTFDISVESVQVQGAGNDFLADGAAVSETHTVRNSILVFDLIDTSVSAQKSASGDTGEFQIEFELTALGNDILIPNQVGSDLANEDEGVYFTFYDEDSMPLTRDWQWSSFFVESANEQGGMFILDEESTEKFTLVVSGTPEASGLYQVAMSAIKYYVGSTQSAIKTLGLGNTHITDPVFLEGSSN